MAFNTEKLRTPQYIFFIYLIAASTIIMIFRFILPGEDAPLLLYSRDWRTIQGALTLFSLFPAIALSALVIPFGIVPKYEEEFKSFSDMFFKRLSSSIILAIIASIIYGVIFFLGMPYFKNKEENMRYAGEMYKLAKMNLTERRAREEWREAAEFLKICDLIWYNNPELSDYRIEIGLKLDELRYEELREMDEARRAISRNLRSANMSALSGNQHPVDATDAIRMARQAFNAKQFFDAHWLAILAQRLMLPNNIDITNSERRNIENSAEFRTATRLASEAWNEISSMAPNPREERQFRIFRLKLDGYNAMGSGDWIRAFYIFSELLTLNPDDPDARNFLALSEKGAKETAFFIDEMELALGEILTGAVFSLPNYDAVSSRNELTPSDFFTQNTAGRSVLRFSSLTTKDDVAYGMDFEYMSFDNNAKPLVSVQSRYAKILPVIINNTPQTMVLMHALDRSDQNTSYNALYLLGEETPGGILININFEDFLLLGEIRRGLSNLQIPQLFENANKFNNSGYVREVFHAEILNRLGNTIFFLPMSIFIIVLAWRYRAQRRPRYLFSIMLFVLPVVFNGFVFLYRSIFNTLGIWLVLSVGFASALVIYIAVLAVSLFASLILLAAQHN